MANVEMVDTNDAPSVRDKPRVNIFKAQEGPPRGQTPSLADLERQRARGIEEQAKAALSTSAYPPVRRVSCEVCDCVLVLRGNVPSFYMKQMAQTIVRHMLRGSLVLDNQLEVDRS